ncbi:MAG: endonuclease/exonuclease/phosphatase family protein [Rikenellaceae bacterium]|nr:endonuclease/exonuclease/phosphatase family protein [Rikenellaceae bacterium]
MKRLMILLVALVAVSCELTNEVIRPLEGVTLMSYNVRSGKGMDGKRDLDRTAAVIRAAQADVVALQEIDSAARRSDGKDVAAVLGKKCSMFHTFSKAIDFDGGGYGVALLSREKPVAVQRFALPGREEARTLLVVEFKHFIVASTHLSLTAEDRMASLSVIDSVAMAAHKPIFIAGDWNATPDSEFGRALGEKMQYLTDTATCTFPADRPDRVIDYIVAPIAQRVEVLHREVINEPMVSDRRPLKIVVKF